MSNKEIFTSYWENIDVQQLENLITNGGDINAQTKGGLTPLMYAADVNPNPEIINTLIMA